MSEEATIFDVKAWRYHLSERRAALSRTLSNLQKQGVDKADYRMILFGAQWATFDDLIAAIDLATVRVK